MIVYGTRASLLKTELIDNQCAHCATTHNLQMNVFQRYGHIFWIPFFPIGKTGVTQCLHCAQVLQLKQMPSALVSSYEQVKAKTKTPWWTFFGVFIIIAVVIAVNISIRLTEQKVNRLAHAPLKNDIWELKLKDHQYTLAKVDKVVGDTIYFFENAYETSSSRALSKIKDKGDSAFIPIPHRTLKSTIIAKAQKGEIIDIDRK